LLRWADDDGDEDADGKILEDDEEVLDDDVIFFPAALPFNATFSVVASFAFLCAAIRRIIQELIGFASKTSTSSNSFLIFSMILCDLIFGSSWNIRSKNASCSAVLTTPRDFGGLIAEPRRSLNSRGKMTWYFASVAKEAEGIMSDEDDVDEEDDETEEKDDEADADEDEESRWNDDASFATLCSWISLIFRAKRSFRDWWAEWWADSGSLICCFHALNLLYFLLQPLCVHG
jgi:hypothetical protein